MTQHLTEKYRNEVRRTIAQFARKTDKTNLDGESIDFNDFIIVFGKCRIDTEVSQEVVGFTDQYGQSHEHTETDTKKILWCECWLENEDCEQVTDTYEFEIEL